MNLWTKPKTRRRRARERVEELADEARQENPDPTTARETFELELMEEGRSDEGEEVQLNEGLDD